MQQLQEHSMKETARMMGITVAAAKARLFHARVSTLRKNSGLKAITKNTHAILRGTKKCQDYRQSNHK